MKTGEVVYYKAELPDVGEESGKGLSDSVLAYEKKMPQEGGKVLMLNRTIKTMTPTEFQAAPRAGEPAPSADAKAKS